jgi:hypothetical protein
MPRFIIERDVPGADKLTSEQLKALAQKSRDVICKIGTDIQWVQSYVAGDKLYCVYIAPNEDFIRKHAEMGGFPANLICRISTVIDPLTADS